MVGPRHHGAAAGLLHAGEDRLGVGRDDDVARVRGLCAPQHMHDHRLARDVHKRFAGQPRRGQPGRNDDEGVLVGHRSIHAGMPAPALKSATKCSVEAAVIRVARGEATGYPSGAAGLRLYPFRVWSLDAMDSFELNKIMGAVLGTCMVLLALNITADAIFTPATPAKPGYAIVVPEKPTAGEKKGPAPQDPPIAELLAKADVTRGQASANKCVACHTFDKGGAQPDRPQSLRRDRARKRLGCRIQLFGGLQEDHERAVDAPGS